MSLWKTLIAGAGFIVVLQQYLQYHSYYEHSFAYWKGLLVLGILWLGLWGSLWIFQMLQDKNELKVSPLRLIAGSFLMIWLTGLGFYFVLEPAVFNEPYDIYLGDESNGDPGWILFDEGTRVQEGAYPFLFRGGIVTDWSDLQPLIHPDLHPKFSRLTLGQFGGNLAVTLLQVLAGWTVLFIGFHNLGAMVLRKTKLTAWGLFESLGIGMGLMMLALFIAGIMGQLTPTVVMGIGATALLLGLPKLPLLLKGVWKTNATLDFDQIHWWTPFALSTLGIVGSLNLISSLKPFPTGFDSLVQYHNTPNLLYQYGELIAGLGAYNYELLISLGHFFSGGQANWGVQVVFFGSLLAFGAFYTLLRRRFSWQHSLLLLSIFTAIPMITFLMNADPKIDLPLLFFSLLTIHSTIEWAAHRDQKSALKWLILTGVWLGIAFGIKYTSLLLIAAVMGVYAYAAWGTLALIGFGLLAFGAIAQVSPPFVLADFENSTQTLLHVAIAAVGALLTAFAIKKKRFKFKQLKPFAITGLVIALVFSPWLIRNVAMSEMLSTKTLLYGENPRLVINQDTFDAPQACTGVESFNELVRYTGAEDVPSLLRPVLTLWESTINSQAMNSHIHDVGVLFLAFFLFLILDRKKRRKEDEEYRHLVTFTLFYGLLWLFIARGFVWYGMPMLIGVMAIYGEWWKSKRWVPGVLVLWMVMSLSLRYADDAYQATGLFYAGGLIDRSIAQEQSLQGSERVVEVLNAEENLDKKVYVIGDFIGYYIDQNDRRIYTDTLLNHFTCYISEGNNWELALERLDELGFEYLIYTEHGLVTEQDPEGPLHEQFEQFREFIDTHLEEVVFSHAMSLYTIPDPDTKISDPETESEI